MGYQVAEGNLATARTVLSRRQRRRLLASVRDGRRAPRADGSIQWRAPYSPAMRILIVLFFGAMALTVAPATCWSASASESSLAHEVAGLRSQVHELGVKLEGQDQTDSSQASAFNADAIAITAAAGVSLLLVTAGGLAAAFLGYKSIQRQARDHLDAKVDASIHSHGEEIFEREAQELRQQYDAKFAEAYERYNRLSA
jgi:hypothetical protein